MDRAQRTHPSAGKASEDKSQYDRKSRKHKRRKYSPRCDDGRQSDQGIEMEKYLHISYIVLSWKMSSQKEVEKKNEKKGLAYDPDYLNSSVFLRSFFFQYSVSPGQLLRDLVHLRS
jgi:hypothetical protein